MRAAERPDELSRHPRGKKSVGAKSQPCSLLTRWKIKVTQKLHTVSIKY